MPNGVRNNPDYPRIDRSIELFKRAEKRIPAGTQTLGKGPSQYVRGVAPIYLQKGKGSHVWDVDGNEYIDYTMGLGPISLGYAYPRVDQAIRDQLDQGITFSLMHPLEVEVAEQIGRLIPNAEMVRFSKTGADVVSAAIRVSRAFTGRKKIVCCGYHGWHDWYISTTTRNAGIPEEIAKLTVTANYNDIDSLAAAIGSDTAAVILEPVLFEAPKDNFLHKLRQLCTERGALLIFDEMWTGFRMALGGAQQLFDVRADLMTYSKAMANGMPIAVLAGRADVLSLYGGESMFFYTTFGGEALSLAATQATLNEMEEKKVTDRLAAQGKVLRDGLDKVVGELGISYVKCIGLDPRTMVTFTAEAGNGLEVKSLVQQELIKRGILWSGQHAVSFSHTDEDIQYTIQAYGEALSVLKSAVAKGCVREWLRGEPVAPIFRTVTGKK